MSDRPPPTVAALNRRRNRLVNRLSPLQQLDLFEPPSLRALREIEDLQAGIAALTAELAKRRALPTTKRE